MSVKIKEDTVPTRLAGMTGYISLSHPDSQVVNVTIPNEGTYRYLRSEIEVLDEESIK